jgi:hypothetical protein
VFIGPPTNATGLNFQRRFNLLMPRALDFRNDFSI